jgi:general secretion pathway protein G
MNIFRQQKSKGFTLIELLVVVAIISLLSSVVLASVREAKDKAQATAYKQHIEEFIKALELYRADYGVYPSGSDDVSVPYAYQIQKQAVEASVSTTNTTFKNKLSPYLSKLPQNKPFTTGTMLAFEYRVNQTSPQYQKCDNRPVSTETTIAPYVILVRVDPHPYYREVFADWLDYAGTVTLSTVWKCFRIN